ncbi:hypothetical protein GUITHDRAFT_109427 [Guillardia theta CCMP2712]|uniref:Carbonic anhydrase n=2 Tax=Guillardia theta TaxID=55529 RepID=L1J9A2_GUITC|nr:hypothetical protein GUITHDRAFT_109427 [Guillardia theta CCMP2712]EKX44650.1 hypothetical protein GUITHDRAFT_109427 [Guillardia theta CCMP2712]|eukprot:XP_005831630.1 hypothetical protein GUITHDRAFT_109427 [Guillardia theta CCMP2712]
MERFEACTAHANAAGWEGRRWGRGRGAIAATSAALLLCLVVLVSIGGRKTSVLQEEGTDSKMEAAEKLAKWSKEVNDLEAEVKKFEVEANEKAVDELVHLAKVKDLLNQLKDQVPLEAPPKPWSYEGATGPDHWAELSSDYQLCGTGQQQSPINIELDLQQASLPSLGWVLPKDNAAVTTKTGDSALAGREFYNGHTFEVESLGSPTLLLGGVTYTLEQFHFHTPSEHKVAGRHYDMEMHFVHSAMVDGQKKLAVIAAFFEVGDNSPAFVKQLFETALPSVSSNPTALAPNLDFRGIAQEVLVGTVPTKLESANEFVPNFKNYFQYTGSLTTPPCTEGVTWVVLKNPVDITAADLSAIQNLEGKNSRPTQPLNGRVVLDVGGSTP